MATEAAVEHIGLSVACEPLVRALSRGEPRRRKCRRTVDDRTATRFDRTGEALGNNEGELGDARAAVPRDDFRLPPFHDALAEIVVKLGRVDDHESGMETFPVCRKHFESLLNVLV